MIRAGLAASFSETVADLPRLCRDVPDQHFSHNGEQHGASRLVRHPPMPDEAALGRHLLAITNQD